MPSKGELKRIVAQSPLDLRQVRLPGIDRPFEQLTISELVQLRPGGEVQDTYEVNAVTDNVSATTSAALEALGRIHKDRVISQALNQQKLDNLRTQLMSQTGGTRGLSAEPGPTEVGLPREDIFSAGSTDPFKA